MLGVHQHGLCVWSTEVIGWQHGYCGLVDCLSKMAYLSAVLDSIDGEGTYLLFIGRVHRNSDYHWLLSRIKTLISRVNFRSRSIRCWAPDSIFLQWIIHRPMSTEHVNRALKDFIRSVWTDTPRHWISMLPIVALAMNNAVHASTFYTPFYVNDLTPPRSGLPHTRS